MIHFQNFGSIEGKIFKDVQEEVTAAGSTWPHYTPPGAETLGEVGARVVSFYKVSRNFLIQINTKIMMCIIFIL